MTPAITSKDLPCLANDLPLQGTSGQSGNSPSHPVLPFLGAQHSFVPYVDSTHAYIYLWLYVLLRLNDYPLGCFHLMTIRLRFVCIPSILSYTIILMYI